jgi:hypothetical protein
VADRDTRAAVWHAGHRISQRPLDARPVPEIVQAFERETSTGFGAGVRL